MEKLHQDFDPLTGLLTTGWLDNEGSLHVDYKRDATQDFEATARTRIDGDAWKTGVKKGWVAAFHIDDGTILELRKIGINVYRDPPRDVISGLKKINRYEACDLTGKRLF